MRKTLLFTACAAMLLGGSAASFAQSADPSTLYYYGGMYNVGTEEEPDEVPFTGQFTKVSANGQYAVGYDNWEFSNFAYIWDATSKDITVLNPYGEFSAATIDVTNDGTIVGGFVNDAGLAVPGYFKNGEWTELPMNDHIYTAYQVSGWDYAPQAQAVTADGKYIAGSACYTDYRYHPMLWVDGVLHEFEGLDDALSGGQGFMVNDISEDGSIIVGWLEVEYNGRRGFRLPAMIDNGQLSTLITMEELYTMYNADPEDSQWVTCEACCIDRQGNITGYIIDPNYGTPHAFIYNKADGMKILPAPIATCSVNKDYVLGMASAGYGPAVFIYEDSTERVNTVTGVTGNSLTAVYDVSDDGKKLAGCGVMILDGVGEVSVPALIDYPGAAPSYVSQVKEDGTKVVLAADGVISVEGSFNNIEVYNMAGSYVTGGVKGQVVSLENMPNGVYVVRVANGSKVQAFKVMK